MQHDRNETPEGIVPGRKPVLEQLSAAADKVEGVYIQKGARGKEIDEIINCCKSNKIRFRLLPRTELDRMCSTNHQGVLLRLMSQAQATLDDLLQDAPSAPLPLIVALDHVQDPGNVGAMARTLYALGGAGFIAPKDRTAYLGAAAYKSSAGALSRLPVARVVNLSRALDQCKDAGWPIYGAAAEPQSQEVSKATLHTPAVLILGNEEKGIRPGVLKRADHRLSVPMARDFDSLNVAQAGAILIWEFARRLKG